MCTRCPTVVSLEVDSSREPFVVLATDAAYSENRCQLQLSDGGVEEHIKQLMDSVTRDGTVSRSPIYIKVVRPSGVTLTMVRKSALLSWGCSPLTLLHWCVVTVRSARNHCHVAVPV